MKHRLIVLVGPSGVGKTTIAKRALSLGISTYMVRSLTDRPKSDTEDNSEYTFVPKGSFDVNACVEHAEYSGNNYGILKSELDNALATPRPIVAAEINGALQLKEYCKGKCDVVLVFVDTSDERLRERLVARGRGGVEERLARVAKDRESKHLCDVCVMNDDDLVFVINDLLSIYLWRSK